MQIPTQFAKTSFIIASIFAVLFASGCSDQQARKPGPGAEAGNVANTEIGDSVENDSILKSIESTYEQAKQAGATTAENVGDWVSETFEHTKDVSTESAGAVTEWAKSMYENARESGTTTATSVKEWTAKDLRKNGSWDYKIVSHESGDMEGFEAKLNELGDQQWECFWVDRKADKAHFYFKKPERSMLKQLPARDLLRLLPLLGGGNDEPAP